MTPTSSLLPGDCIAVSFGPGLQHYGIVTQRGTVISNSRLHSGVIEQSLSTFANGRTLRLCERPDTLDAQIAVQRARARRGAPYRLHESNCIDLIQHSYRRRPTSWQYVSATLQTVRDMLRR